MRREATPQTYDPAKYWGSLIGRRFDLRDVGYPELSLAYNDTLYQAMRDTVDAAVASEVIAGKSVLDIGSGTGFWIQYWRDKGAGEIVGLDLTESSVNHLRARYPEHKFQRADISEPLEGFDQRFDIISVMSVFNHVPWQERWETALRNAARALKPNGLLLVMDPMTRYRWWGAPTSSASNGRYRSVRQHEAVLAEQGVRVTATVPVATLLANPMDAGSKLEHVLQQLWWRVFIRIAARERVMRATRFAVYPIDRALAKLGYMPSSKLLICRKSG